MKPLSKIRIRWSSQFAYAIGLIATDGSLSKDGRHIVFTSKDRELIQSFSDSLGLKAKFGLKSSGSVKDRRYFYVQFSSVIFYKFLEDIGLFPNKTHTLGALKIPEKYFFDFLRGHFDGDGTFYSYWDPRWKNSFMFYLVFLSASKDHILWLQKEIYEHLRVNGHITSSGKGRCLQLKFAKKEALLILRKLYPRNTTQALARKRLKIKAALAIINEQI